MAFSTPKTRDAKTQSSATTPPHGVMAPQIDSGQCAPQEARAFLRLLPISRGRRTELAGGLSPTSGRNEQENESTTDRPADTLCCLPSSPLTGARTYERTVCRNICRMEQPNETSREEHRAGGRSERSTGCCRGRTYARGDRCHCQSLRVQLVSTQLRKTLVVVAVRESGALVFLLYEKRAQPFPCS